MPVKSTSHSSILLRVFMGILIVVLLLVGLSAFYLKKAVSSVKSDNGRVNVLVLGKAGKDHAGGDLTDTMILASVSLTKPNIILISIPRDVWIPEIRAKINSAYYWGGSPLSKSTTEGVLGVPIQYSLVIDFSGFKKVIDVLGGIEIDVTNSFADEKYPITGKENDLCGGDIEYKCRYETIKFEKGKQVMNGETALKFVRSRNSEGNEGTDIAREARQQLLINGLKEKVLSPKVILNPLKLLVIFRVMRDSIETDIGFSQAVVFAKGFLLGRNTIKSYLIPEDLLEHPPISPKFDNQYVFIPKGGDWKEVQKWLQSILN